MISQMVVEHYKSWNLIIIMHWGQQLRQIWRSLFNNVWRMLTKFENQNWLFDTYLTSCDYDFKKIDVIHMYMWNEQKIDLKKFSKYHKKIT